MTGRQKSQARFGHSDDGQISMPARNSQAMAVMGMLAAPTLLIIVASASCSDADKNNDRQTTHVAAGAASVARESSGSTSSRHGSVMPLQADPPLPGITQPDADLAKALEKARAAKGASYKPRTSHFRSDGTPKYTNRLIYETSPYLLQHAHNPVNWYAWTDDAFARAELENKPILLSVGYSTCHWCHVMERESFEDEEIARYLNENFIAIKVDREERPDIDDVYMKAVQMLTGSGGWPMTVALTPDRKPFFGGTYFPPRDGSRGARKGFLTILRELSAAYRRDPQAVIDRAEELSSRIQHASRAQPPGSIPSGKALYLAASQFARAYDPVWGGFATAPKFPRPVAYDLLLRYYRRTNDAQALHIVTRSLEQMAAGGIYDQIAGGFHRYSTDRQWLIPHFEKMLYDNAQLSVLYLDAFQVTGRAAFARTARETLDYVAREMTSPEGGFYSATDADSKTPEGDMEEGRFFTWTPAEIEAAVGSARAPVVRAYYGVTEAGNMEGRSVLYLPHSPEQVAETFGIEIQTLRNEIEAANKLLYETRSHRPAPLRDEKILTAWNGLMISAFARGAFVLDRADYTERARAAANFVLEHMSDDNGRLYRSFNDGRASHPAFLDDYAFFIQGLLDLYEATYEPRWLSTAIGLQDRLDTDFLDAENGGYFMTSGDHERLIARDRPLYDGAEPSGNSIALANLLRLEEFTTDEAYRKTVEAGLSAFASALEDGSTGVPRMLSALDYYLDRPLEIMIVASENDLDTLAQLRNVLRTTYLPNRVASIAVAGRSLESQAVLIPLLEGKGPLKGRTTAYVCERGVCRRPTSDPEVLASQLARIEPLLADEKPPPLPTVAPRH